MGRAANRSTDATGGPQPLLNCASHVKVRTSPMSSSFDYLRSATEMSLFRPVLFASALVGLAALYSYRPSTSPALTPHPVIAWTSRQPTVHIKAEVEINAPAAVVFDHLTHPTTWPTWNSFVLHPLQNGREPSELQRAIAPGDVLTMNCMMPYLDPARPPENVEVKDRIVLVQPPAEGTAPEVYYVQWVDSMFPDWLFRVSRLHTITATAPDACVYESDTRFYGPLSWVVKWRFSERLRLGGREAWMGGMKVAMERYMQEMTAEK